MNDPTIEIPEKESWRKPEYSPHVSIPPSEWKILSTGYYELAEPQPGLGGYYKGLFHNTAGTPYDPQPGVVWTVEEYAAKKEVYDKLGRDFLPGLIKGSPACESYLISISTKASLGDALTFVDVLAGGSVRRTAAVDLRAAYNTIILTCDEMGGDRRESLLKLRARICRMNGMDVSDVAMMSLQDFVQLLTKTALTGHSTQAASGSVNSNDSSRSAASHFNYSVIKTMRTGLIDSNKVNVTLEVGGDDGQRVADLVFIHGLGGGSQTTWAFEGKPENFWPDWIGEEFPSLGVWTMGYNSSVSAWNEQSMPLADLGNSVLERMVNRGIGDRPIIFVTHSMGGLVAKQLISHSKTQGVTRFKRIAEQMRGVAFIATPHAGAKLANFAEFLGIVLNAGDQVSELKQHDSRLRSLHQAFLSTVTEQKLICRAYAERYEVKVGTKILGFDVKIPKGILVVDPTSAEPHLPGETAIPLEEDHISICKPTDRDAAIHESIRGFLRECIEFIENS